jgi:phosphate ABC transporter phosphate-binding protein
MKQRSTSDACTRWLTTGLSLLSLLLACTLCLRAQTASDLRQVKKIYVDTFIYKANGSEIQQHIIDALRKDHAVQVVPSADQADAILKGTGETWIKAYIAVNPRAPGNRYPTYGGFLSAQLIGRDQETLWSYLVTPSNYSPSGIHQDLAEKLVKNLQTALNDAASINSTHPAQPASRIIKAAGATFPAPLYQEWMGSFRQHHPDIQISYDSIGSDAGIEQLREQKITLAASDVPLSPAEMAGMPTKILQFATVIGAVVPIYNLRDVGHDLHFTPEVLAGIYLGKIHRWNDPVIKAINHGVTLPDADIIVIHRADGSGTTYAFTDFLSKTTPAWKTAIGTGTTVNWPTGRAVQGNEAVASAVARTPNSIGYSELTFAIQKELSFGMVRNAAGNFVQANLFSLSAATAGTDAIPASLTNAPGKDAYPITSFTWLLVPESIPDPATKSAVAEFLDWILTSGQKECSALAYNPLPREALTHELQMLATFKSK